MDPPPAWFAPPVSAHSSPGRGTPAAPTISAAAVSVGLLPNVVHNPPLSQSSSFSMGSADLGSEDSLPSFQRPSSRDVHMLSPRHETPVRAATAASSVPAAAAGAAPRSLSFQVQPDLWSLLRESESGSVASEAPHDPQPVLEVFKKAAERTGVPWPTAAVPQAEVAAPDPQGWFGLRPPQPKMVRDKVLPAARGFQQAIQTTWKDHKHPPRERWLLDVAGADAMGIAKLPSIDPTLAYTLDSYHKKYSEQYAKTPGGRMKPPGMGFDLNASIPFLDPAARKAAVDDRALYEAVGYSTRDTNALALLLGSLRSQLMVDPEGQNITPEELELDRVSELALQVCKRVTQWHGRMMDMLVLQI